MWEGRATEGRGDELQALVLERAWPVMEAVEGFEGGELFRSIDAPDLLVLITRWAGEAALERFAGPGWREAPVVLPEERELLARQPQVWHFHSVG